MNYETKSNNCETLQSKTVDKFRNGNRMIWIDAGNSRNSGQVLIGNTNSIKTLQEQYADLIKKPNTSATRYLPAPTLVIPELLQAEPQIEDSNLSCAELIAREEQDLLINQAMGLCTSQYLYRLLSRQSIQTYLSYIGTFSMRSIPIQATTLINHLPNEQEKIAS